jgi:CheY-like chemotaxis protein
MPGVRTITGLSANAAGRCGEPAGFLSMPPDSSAPVIVHVDDDKDASMIFGRIVAHLGMRARFMPLLESDEAIAFFERAASASGGVEVPTICFLDIHMPVLNGFDVLRWIRQHASFDLMPVVMLTSSDERRDLDRACRLGAQCYLTKYPTPNVLGETIEHALAYRAGPTSSELFSFGSNLLVAGGD